ncbi:MAG TPA: hypothetical protein PK299_04985 [Anaerolineales bacterium]|nr:hypothetical protein [Anaerolineales bacterium]
MKHRQPFVFLMWLVFCLASCRTAPVPQPTPSVELPPVPSPTPALLPTPTAPDVYGDWKLYTTEDFSLRYPPDWQANGVEGEFAGSDGEFVRVRKYRSFTIGRVLPYCITLANENPGGQYGVIPKINSPGFRLSVVTSFWVSLLKSNFGTGDHFCWVMADDISQYPRHNERPDQLTSTLLFKLHENGPVWEVSAKFGAFWGIVNSLVPNQPLPQPTAFPTIMDCQAVPELKPLSQTVQGLEVNAYPITKTDCDSGILTVLKYQLVDQQNLQVVLPYTADVGAFQGSFSVKYSETAKFFHGASALVEIWQGEQVVKTISIPPAGSLDPIKGFTVWRDSWYLSLDGVVFKDGENWNTAMGYDWVTHWHLVNDAPMFFYQRGSESGVGYLTDPPVHIPFNGYDIAAMQSYCCQLDPTMYQNGVGFYAQRDGIWWWVTVTLSPSVPTAQPTPSLPPVPSATAITPTALVP